MSDEIAELKEKLAKVLEALDLAESIMSFARGDAYERECTDEDYRKFTKIYEEFNPPPPPKQEVWMAPKKQEPKIECPTCGKKCVGKKGLQDHNKAKHLGSLRVSGIHEMIGRA